MKQRRPLDVVVPKVHGTVYSLRMAERAIAEAGDATVPADPLVRAALRAGVDDTIRGLEGLMRSLDTVRRKLE
jgi:hypothetical protein